MLDARTLECLYKKDDLKGDYRAQQTWIWRAVEFRIRIAKYQCNTVVLIENSYASQARHTSQQRYTGTWVDFQESSYFVWIYGQKARDWMRKILNIHLSSDISTADFCQLQEAIELLITGLKVELD